MPIGIIYGLAHVKRAAALTHKASGALPADIADAIIAAADAILAAQHDDQFPLVIWQTGSGTQSNMNVNEVIAGIANEALAGIRGGKTPVHPNDHVNMGQSSNDSFPTAIHVAVAIAVWRDLLPALQRLTDALTEKARLSRGLLCADWLEGASLTTWLGQHVGGDFGGCNVVLGELTSGARHFLRNQPETAADCVDNQLAPMGVGWWGCPLESGIHVLSNASLDTPWPKVVALRQAVLEATVTSPDTRAKEVPSGAMQVALLEALRDRQRYEPPVRARASSAFDRSALHALSACFVDWAEKDYGTRSSTLMWVSSAQTDTIGLQEWTYVNGAIDQASSAGPQYLRMG